MIQGVDEESRSHTLVLRATTPEECVEWISAIQMMNQIEMPLVLYLSILIFCVKDFSGVTT